MTFHVGQRVRVINLIFDPEPPIDDRTLIGLEGTIQHIAPYNGPGDFPIRVELSNSYDSWSDYFRADELTLAAPPAATHGRTL